MADWMDLSAAMATNPYLSLPPMTDEVLQAPAAIAYTAPWLSPVSTKDQAARAMATGAAKVCPRTARMVGA
jgi:hypothetical protein